MALQLRRNRRHELNLHTVTPSPLKATLPSLSSQQISILAYKPDYFPGARDVNTPYGSCRVYEFGPENGTKVLLVHGISTPCISLGGLAHELVKKGCRVMLYGNLVHLKLLGHIFNFLKDLYGRGYSDNPTFHEHSSHLYNTQILSVIVSSPLPWTDENSFIIIGYSLGGGIAASFAYYFPALVKSLVLIAPSGLVREKHIAWQSYILYRTEGILPESLVRWLVRRRLDNPAAASAAKHGNYNIQIDDAIAAELGESNSISGDHVSQVMESAVQWQLDHHKGFITAFVSAIRYAPITAQYETYKVIGRRLGAQKMESSNKLGSHEGFAGGKVILVLGTKDGIVVREETDADHRQMLGDENVETIVMDVGHDIPISKPLELAARLWDAWKNFGAI